MSSAKIAAACALAAVSLSGCGVASKPVAGSAQAVTVAHQEKADPRTRHAKCLKADRIPYSEETVRGPGSGPQGYPSIQIGKAPSGPLAEFAPTPGAAQYAQMQAKNQGFMVIGSALVFPNQAPDTLMTKVIACMDEGVSG
ncbi:MAG TPA: hypothetical protein VKV21_06320 [Solirubrobacteraceae bacterium]|nr:hypothetical protein [Solirubrobacteraceae bacterium]